VDIEIALELITAPIIVRGLIQGQTLGADYPDRLAAAVLRGIGYTKQDSPDGAPEPGGSTPGSRGNG
jgi:hypothetical protein